MAGGSFALVVVVAILGLSAWGCPQYNVYSARMKGEAQLAESEAARQTMVSEARARLDAAKMNAESIETEGTALEKHKSYLTKLWIEKINDNGNTVIYIPTEAGLPVLEAGRPIGRKE